VNLKERIRSLLEVESCVNDPAAVILTFAVVAWIKTGQTPGWMTLIGIPLQLAIGGVVGVGIGLLMRWILGKVHVTTAGLYPVVTLSAAFLAFGAATLLWGSGFLAVFAAGVVLGNGPLPYRTGLKRVHDSVAWMSQVSMFLMLGLLVSLSDLLAVAVVGLLLGLALALVARPLACLALLLPFRRPFKETAFVGWVGLRGAVPIVLGTVPVMAGIPGGEHVFHVVFFIVVLSAIVPGASIVPLARRLGLDDPMPPTPAAALEIHSLGRVEGQVRAYYITDALAVCGAPLSGIPFPQGAAAVLIVRGAELLAARGPTVLQDGDYVYVFYRPEDEEYITLLFGEPAGE
jgi:cell volume regulation protein A